MLAVRALVLRNRLALTGLTFLSLVEPSVDMANERDPSRYLHESIPPHESSGEPKARNGLCVA